MRARRIGDTRLLLTQGDLAVYAHGLDALPA